MTRKILASAILLMLMAFSVATGQSNPKNPSELIKRGNASYSKAEYIAALDHYTKVPRQAGKVYSQALYNIGVCYYELWRTEEAIVMYRKAIAARAGRYPIAFYALGVAFEDLKREDGAGRRTFGLLPVQHVLKLLPLTSGLVCCSLARKITKRRQVILQKR